jgi:hypothetical protein
MKEGQGLCPWTKLGTSRQTRLIPTGLDPASCGIGVASVPAQTASGSFLKKRTKKLFTLKSYADRNTYAK